MVAKVGPSAGASPQVTSQGAVNVLATEMRCAPASRISENGLDQTDSGLAEQIWPG